MELQTGARGQECRRLIGAVTAPAIGRHGEERAGREYARKFKVNGLNQLCSNEKTVRFWMVGYPGLGFI